MPRRQLIAGLAALPLLRPRPLLAADAFQAWLQDLRRDAASRGIRRATLDAALADLDFLPRVIELDRKQPEGRLTFAQYRSRVMTQGRIDRGRDLLAANRDTLRQVERRFGVPARVIVALWGLESNFGERQGGFSVVEALATLAFEGRRAAFFRKELLSALRILDAGDVPPAAMTGSWAGAMGQCQFMPSTYLGYAVDFDGDGRRDIWRTVPDVLASAANYLARAGWDPGLRWGRQVAPPGRLPDGIIGLDHRASIEEWRRHGVRLPDGGSLPRARIDASLIRFDDPEDGFLVYDNFRTIMVWNRSTYFALAVGLLSDLIEPV